MNNFTKDSKYVFAVDFDGTCVTHAFPYIGLEIGAASVLKELTNLGHKIILFTMRSDIENPTSDDYNIHPKGGNYLSDAVQWFKDNDIPLYGINTNPQQLSWTTSPKAYADYYIDDASIGTPMFYNKLVSDKPFVNWVKIRELLVEQQILS